MCESPQVTLNVAACSGWAAEDCRPGRAARPWLRLVAMGEWWQLLQQAQGPGRWDMQLLLAWLLGPRREAGG